MNGRISSVQSLGAVDGPGLRYVVFMQGCPLRCKYCHNPETWPMDGGSEMSAEELCSTISRYTTYFGETGGVTVSGGEPLMQAEFIEELFIMLHKRGIHTALDTSGAAELSRAERVLKHTDLVLCDLKFPTEDAYRENCGGSLRHTLSFMELAEKMQVPMWIRHVVAPGLTDSADSIRAVKELCSGFSNIEKIEWLPFKNICSSKYDNLKIDFPMAGQPALSQKFVEELVSSV